jgi:glycosyltransferase involved in cell wall biosynthesis
MRKVCVVIPTRNEERTIERVIGDIRAALDPEQFAPPSIVVVDDSTDRTRELAAQAGATVLIGGGRGLGSAMYEGLKAAARRRPDFIVSVDGDGQADGAEIPRFLEPLLDGRADLVIGSRFADRGLIGYRYRLINRLGTLVLARILRGFTGLHITDSHGGIRAMRAAVAAELEMLGTHTYVQETIIDAAEKGFRIVEIPSAWKKRSHGRSRVVGSIPRYVFYTLPILILRSGQHVRLLYSGGILLVLAAVAYFLVVLAQAGFNVKATFARVPAFIFIALLVSIGFQCFFFGLVLQLLKQLKYQVDRVGGRRAARRAPGRRSGRAVTGRR